MCKVSRGQCVDLIWFFFFKQKTAYEMRIRDWSSDVCSSDLEGAQHDGLRVRQLLIAAMAAEADMLRAFACWLSPRTVLASYNGRCYDAPLLKTRYRLDRLPDPLGEQIGRASCRERVGHYV